MNVLYLDNMSGMRVLPEVREAMLALLGDDYGNASSLHKPGRRSSDALKEARTRVAQMLSAHDDEVYFAPSGTQSNNTALLGRVRYAEAHSLGKHIITTATEHSSVAETIAYMEQALGWRVTRLSVDVNSGCLSSDEFNTAVCDDTSIISIAAVDGLVGTSRPIAEIAALANERKIYFHCDASALPGRVAIDCHHLGVNSLSFSGHKFGGPKGSGILYLRRATGLMPSIFGGGQEMGYFPGTEGLAQNVGIGIAAESAGATACDDAAIAHLISLQNYLRALISCKVGGESSDSTGSATTAGRPGVQFVGLPPLECPQAFAFNWAKPQRLPGQVALRILDQSGNPCDRHTRNEIINFLSENDIAVGCHHVGANSNLGDKTSCPAALAESILLIQFDKTHAVEDCERFISALQNACERVLSRRTVT